jgi:PAS domain S-box-containing protein
MKAKRIPTAANLEKWHWSVRALLGGGAAVIAVLLTYTIGPLRNFPMLLAFPAVVLSSLFLGMWGGVLCAFTEAVLVDLYLARSSSISHNGDVKEALRLTFFLLILILLSRGMRRLGHQSAQLKTQELEKQLALAEAEHKLAEERARASEELRERDELLKIALEVNGMGMWVWDLRENAAYGSDPVCDIVGSEPGSANRLPRNWLRVLHPEDAASVRTALAKVRATGRDYHQQYRLLSPDGSVRWMESQGKCQHDSAGSATRVVGVLADVTHRKLTEEAMLRTEKLAVAGRLAASVAHEINNPLSAVGNLLYLISTAEDAGEIKNYARQAMDELMRISLITQQTLQFHRQPGAPANTLLSEIVAGVMTLFRGKLRSAGIEVEVRADQEVPVACMPSEIHQVFANLVGNAIDAMPQGGRILLRLRPTRDWRDGKSRGMRVTIADSGMGMNRATMRRIFDPFFTTKTETGTGLGLWVVAQMLERRHGHVRVWSWRNAITSGTAFSVFLPFLKTSE